MMIQYVQNYLVDVEWDSLLHMIRGRFFSFTTNDWR